MLRRRSSSFTNFSALAGLVTQTTVPTATSRRSLISVSSRSYVHNDTEVFLVLVGESALEEFQRFLERQGLPKLQRVEGCLKQFLDLSDGHRLARVGLLVNHFRRLRLGQGCAPAEQQWPSQK